MFFGEEKKLLQISPHFSYMPTLYFSWQGDDTLLKFVNSMHIHSSTGICN